MKKIFILKKKPFCHLTKFEDCHCVITSNFDKLIEKINLMTSNFSKPEHIYWMYLKVLSATNVYFVDIYHNISLFYIFEKNRNLETWLFDWNWTTKLNNQLYLVFSTQTGSSLIRSAASNKFLFNAQFVVMRFTHNEFDWFTMPSSKCLEIACNYVYIFSLPLIISTDHFNNTKSQKKNAQIKFLKFSTYQIL